MKRFCNAGADPGVSDRLAEFSAAGRTKLDRDAVNLSMYPSNGKSAGFYMEERFRQIPD